MSSFAKMAGMTGFEPVTVRLTAESSAIELHTIIYIYIFLQQGLEPRFYGPKPYVLPLNYRRLWWRWRELNSCPNRLCINSFLHALSSFHFSLQSVGYNYLNIPPRTTLPVYLTSLSCVKVFDEFFVFQSLERNHYVLFPNYIIYSFYEKLLLRQPMLFCSRSQLWLRC